MSPSRFTTLTILLLPLSLFCATSLYAQATGTGTWSRQAAATPAALCSATSAPTPAPVLTMPAAAPAAPAVTVVAPEAPSCAAPAPACAAPCATAKCATGTCNGKCKCEWKCPKYYFTQEKMPCIKFCKVCSQPLADPCSVAEETGYGYTPTCWRPMGPFDYTHCTCPPPAILAQDPSKGPAAEPRTPEKAPEDEPAPIAPNRVGMATPGR